MTKAAQLDNDVPVWARLDAFPPAPSGWGWLDFKGRLHPCATPEELVSAIRRDRTSGVVLAWTPECRYMILPEEVEGAAEAVCAARRRRAEDEMAYTRDKLRWFGWLLAGLAVYMLYEGLAFAPRMLAPPERLQFALKAVLGSMSIGVAALVFLIFAFIPWYQARKHLRELELGTDDGIAALVPVLRFETWMELQKAPVTRLLLALTALVGLAQLMPGDGISAAGLVKADYEHGEWWRLFTAPLLHGNLIHFLMNASALLYLGKRIEVFARWPHVPLVFLFAAIVGGEASARFLAATTIGASGGLMGWLGFLLVFESLHDRLVPRKARRRLLAGVFLTGLIGLVGYRFIDNAAHAGGLLAGMLYAGIVFPRSSSPNRPGSTVTDRVAGGLALVMLIAAAVFAVLKILFS